MTKKRQEKRNEEVKLFIVKTAEIIISEEGLDNLSIRKIAKKIDYSPSIIYHYFKNKDELLLHIWKKNYMKILHIIKNSESNQKDLEKNIIDTFKSYIYFALDNPDLYKNILLNDNIEVLNQTSLLQKGDGKKRKTLNSLYKKIELGKEKNIFKKDLDSELTSQIIWTSTFGLIIRIIKDKINDKDQIENLINVHFKILFNGIKIN